MGDSSLGVYISHGYGIGGGGRQEARAIVELRLFRRSKLRSCLLGLEESKKEEKLARRRRQMQKCGYLGVQLFRGCGISSGRQQWMATDAVFQETDAEFYCFGAGRKKTKWPYVEGIINNMARAL